MPYSFTQIEKDRSRTISLAFLFLIFMYFVSSWLIYFVVANLWRFESWKDSYEYQIGESMKLLGLDWASIGFIFIISAIIALLHFAYTTSDLIPKISGILQAEPLDLKDRYHKMFRNILDEVSVATGGTKIEGVVIPTTALNAFAIADFDGRNVIGVTEGLLYRLNRAQLEAVVGHEAAHIVSGDCLTTTVTTSIYSLYSGIMKGISKVMTRETSEYGGRYVFILYVVYFLLAIMQGLSYLGSMFISREREYRADAISVRLTRDPLSLAEALYKIAYKWRGAGLAAQELEAIFILNPQYELQDEKEGFLANLYSTHPPILSRLNILLDLAHVDKKTLVENVDLSQKRFKEPVPTQGTMPAQKGWFIFQDGKWNGPMAAALLASYPQLTAESWIMSTDSPDIMMAYQVDEIKNMKEAVHNGDRTLCPKCQVIMTTLIYEDREVRKCNLCHGTFLHEKDIKRIIIRQDVEFPENIIKLANVLQDDMNKARVKEVRRDPAKLLPCPVCSGKAKVPIVMNRLFYTLAYPVEVDRCLECGMYWFDKDELEILQYLIEKNT